MLAAVVLGGYLVRNPPRGSLGIVLGSLLVLALGWIFVSVLWPARADRTCPACGAKALVRVDPDETHGLECAECGWRDETTSAWLIAEEEGPLEDVVLRQREARRGAKAGGPGMDTQRPAH
jgi:hypothetical protein